MTTRRLYIRDIHDPILTDLCLQHKLSDYEIAERMEIDRVTVYKNRVRLGLPANARSRPKQQAWEKSTVLTLDKPNPITASTLVLGRRLVEKPSGFWLDGRPVSTEEMVKTANQIRKADGVEQIGPPNWRVP